jgi:methylthioribulose-1-phosphate dehydratase
VSASLAERPAATIDDARALICALGARFYEHGWVSGTGGGISIRVSTADGARVVMAPSGVQKELLTPESMFVLDMNGDVVTAPADPQLACSQCRPLFLAAMQKRDAGAVIHSHSKHAALATLAFTDRVRLRKLEMLKGLAGVGYEDTHEVPIIENTAHERDLTASLSDAIDRFPAAHAVLVRRHGVYIWGRDWIEAKRHAECYHWLFEVAVEAQRMGVRL